MYFLLKTIKHFLMCLLKQTEETQIHGNSYFTVTRVTYTLDTPLFCLFVFP